MGNQYRKAMQALYLACIVLSGVAMVVITLFIPAGVFMRYVMNNPLQWPEPASVILMVFFSFIGGAAVYRANQQIAVEALMKAVGPRSRTVMQWGVHACMLLIAATVVPFAVHAAGWIYLVGSTILGIWFLARCITFSQTRDDKTARGVLRGSLVHLVGVMALLVADGVMPKYFL